MIIDDPSTLNLYPKDLPIITCKKDKESERQTIDKLKDVGFCFTHLYGYKNYLKEKVKSSQSETSNLNGSQGPNQSESSKEIKTEEVNQSADNSFDESESDNQSEESSSKEKKSPDQSGDEEEVKVCFFFVLFFFGWVLHHTITEKVIWQISSFTGGRRQLSLRCPTCMISGT